MGYIAPMERTPEDQADTREEAERSRREAEASLACEGLYLTDEQRALFDEFDAKNLPDDERIKRILARHVPAHAKVTAGD